jgi:WD40 repeat protein
MVALGTRQGAIELRAANDLRLLHPPYTTKHSDKVISLAWLNEALLVSVSEDGQVLFWDPWTGQEYYHTTVAPGFTYLAPFSSDEVAIATDSGHLTIYHWQQGLLWQQQISGSAVATCLPELGMIAAGDREGKVYLWKPFDDRFTKRTYHEHIHQGENPLDPEAQRSAVCCVSISPSGRFLLSCDVDRFASIIVL